MFKKYGSEMILYLQGTFLKEIPSQNMYRQATMNSGMQEPIK